MNTFQSFFTFEVKRFFGRRNILVVCLLFFLALFFIQSGIQQYEERLELAVKFQAIEKAKIANYINYTQYGAYGFRMLFAPAPISIFFSNTGVIPEMTSFVDSGERLQIYTPLEGKNIFDLKKFGFTFTDFSGVILFFGSLLGLFYGYDTFKNDEYMKFLATLARAGRVFICLLLSRVLLLLVLFLAMTGSGLLLAAMNGIHIPLDRFFVFFILSIFLVGLFFFLAGFILSTLQSRIIGVTAILICWFLLLFFAPTVLSTYISEESDLITPAFQLEMEKLKLLSRFEKLAIEKVGRYKEENRTKKSIQELMEQYMQNDFVKIQAQEKKMYGEINRRIERFQFLSILTPSTFYLSVTNEISSRGFQNYTAFYKYAMNLKEKFVRFYMDKKYYSNHTQVESFIKKNENVFTAGSRLPKNFYTGLGINAIYIIGLLLLGYSRYYRSIHTPPDVENPVLYPADLKDKRNDFKVLVTEGNHLKNKIYNICSDGNDAFLYICHPENIPRDIKVADFLAFIKQIGRIKAAGNDGCPAFARLKPFAGKTFGRLENHRRGEIMLSLLQTLPKQIYLVHDISREMPIEYTVRLKDCLDELKRKGALVLYLTPNELLNFTSLKKNHGFRESSSWGQLVEHYRGLMDIGSHADITHP